MAELVASPLFSEPQAQSVQPPPSTLHVHTRTCVLHICIGPTHEQLCMYMSVYNVHAFQTMYTTTAFSDTKFHTQKCVCV